MRIKAKLGAILGIAVGLALINTFVKAQQFSTPINISNSPGRAFYQTVSVDKLGNINVIWMDSRDIPVGSYDVFYCRSNDGGLTFSCPLNISHSISGVGNPQMALDDAGDIFVIWNKSQDIFFSRSIDGGVTFSNPLIVATSERAHQARLATDSQGKIFVVFPYKLYVPDASHYQIRVRCSPDKGQTFLPPLVLADAQEAPNIRTDFSSPQIAVNSQGRIGVTWIKEISEYTGPVTGWQTTMVDLFFCLSTDGTSYSSPVNVSSSPGLTIAESYYYWNKKLVIDDYGKVYVIWKECTSTTSCGYGYENYWEVYFSHSDDGITFSSPINVSSDLDVSWHMSLTVSPQGEINVLWASSLYYHPYSTDALFCRSTDGGLGFSVPINLSFETGFQSSVKPRMAVDYQGNINVAWYDDRTVSGGYTEIFFSRSSDGISFSSPMNVSDTLNNHSSEPSLAVDEQGNVYLTWVEGFAADSEVYFCRGIFNQSPVAEAGGPYLGTEGTPIALDGSGSVDPEDNIVSYEWDLDGDGMYDDAVGSTPMFTWPDNITLEIGLKVTDDSGQSSNDTASVTIGNLPPVIATITTPVDPVPINTQVNASGTFTDKGVLDTHTAVWDWGDGATSEGEVTEADGSGSVVGSHSYVTPGIYTVTLTVTDKDGGVAQATSALLVVYDPAGGFVTGAGWFNSPPGAYSPDPALTGRAHFGFVSKYQKGATVPTGQTKFHFQVANLNFHSDTYQWMVVAGARAQYKGTGTINNQGSYGFMIVAIDGQIPGGGGLDKFRIKIWDTATDAIVYDNEMGASETGDPFTVIEGGSIVIHKQ